MQELRLSLADARARLRSARDAYELVKAESEQCAIVAGANGKNAEERARALTLALTKDDMYCVALGNLRRAEHEVERLDALLESARDARRAEEWQIRAKLSDGLFRAGVQSDASDPAGDTVFDDSADSTLVKMLTGRITLNYDDQTVRIDPPSNGMPRDPDDDGYTLAENEANHRLNGARKVYQSWDEESLPF